MTATGVHRRSQVARVETPVVRVAIYARKSTDKNLDSGFTTIDNQVASVAAYVASQVAHGWVAMPEPYTDGGFSGATTDRPAFQRLLADVRAGRVNVIAVSRLDRLSRSVRDFIDLLALFEKHGVQFVSVTEHFDTTTPMGRFTLGIFMQVAQLEREVIAERVRSKMRAARRLGKWQGGRPVLGYDVVEKKLEINPAEAADVVAIFQTYARTTSIVATLRELATRGIRLKSWTTKLGRKNDGAAFRDHSLTSLLRNPLYVGLIHAGEAPVKAEHEAIVPRELFDEVQALLAGGRRQHAPRQAWGALLTGLLHCAVCGSAMVPSYCTKASTRYGYYVCQRIKDHGASACPGSRVAQGTIEAAVIERIMAIGRDPTLVADAVRAARAEVEAQAAALAQDAQRAGTEAHRLAAERDNLVARSADVPELRQRLDDMREAHEAATGRATTAKDALAALRARVLDEDALRRAIECVAPCWEALFPAERTRLIRLLVERVSVDARTGQLDVAFHAGGVSEWPRGGGSPRSY